MHILVCDDDAAFSAKVAEYAATYFEAHEMQHLIHQQGA